MDDVTCTGTESHIGLCNHNPIDNCGAGEGAGVICPYDTDANRVTLVGGNTANEGNVMLNGRPIWYVRLEYLIATAVQFWVISCSPLQHCTLNDDQKSVQQCLVLHLCLISN